MSAIQQLMLSTAGKIARSTPTEVSSVALASSSSSTLTVGAASSVVAGDLIIIFASSTQPFVTPSGYTLVDGSASGVTNTTTMRTATFYTYATGADSSTTISSPSSSIIRAYKVAIRGVDDSLAIQAATRGEINVSSVQAVTPVGLEKDQMILGCAFGWNTAAFTFGNFTANSSLQLGSTTTIRSSPSTQYTGTIYRTTVAADSGASVYGLSSTLSSSATHIAHTVLAIYGLPL